MVRIKKTPNIYYIIITITIRWDPLNGQKYVEQLVV